jgi:tetratricopeptide (TPR) repeat protein
VPVKRALVLTGVLAIAAVSGALAYRSAARERSYRVLIASGEAALASGETIAAVENFSGAIAVRPDAMLARLRRGETYRRRGDLDVAARDFRAASLLDPTATRPLESLGDVLYAQERFRRSAETYEARLRLDDRSALVRYKLALARYRDGAADVALDEARRAVALDDQLADAHYLIALCLRDLGQPEEAIASLTRAIDRAPGMMPAREELADMYAAAGRFTEQLAQLQVLAGLDTRRTERQVAIGLAQAGAGRAELAVATLTAALDQAADPSPVNAALGRVWLQLAESRPDRPEATGRALEALERAASALTATSETKALYGRALARSGQLDAAEQLFQQAIERYPVDPSAFRQLGLVADGLGHTAVARSAFMQYLALVPTDPDAAAFAARIGALSLTLNEASAALPWLQRALVAKPDDLPVLTSMVEAQLLAGDTANARLTLTRALALQPGNRDLQRLERRIRKAEG